MRVKKQPKKDLLLDLDNTVLNYAEYMVETYTKLYGQELKPIELSQWINFNLKTSFGKEVADKMNEIHNSPGFFRNLKPLPYALEVVDELLTMVNVIVCTSPTKIVDSNGLKHINPTCLKEKQENLIELFPKLTEDIIFARQKEKVVADYLADDAIHNISKWCGKHINGTGFLIKQLHNKTCRIPMNALKVELKDLPKYVKANLDDN